MQSSSFSLLFYLYSIPIHLKSKIQLPKYFYTHCEIHSVCKLRIYISIKFEYMLDVVSLLMVIKIRHRGTKRERNAEPGQKDRFSYDYCAIILSFLNCTNFDKPRTPPQRYTRTDTLSHGGRAEHAIRRD